MSRSCPPRLQLDSKMGVKDICSKVFETWCVFVAVRVLGVCSSQHCTVCLKFTKPVDLMCSHHVKKKITVKAMDVRKLDRGDQSTVYTYLKTSSRIP